MYPSGTSPAAEGRRPGWAYERGALWTIVPSTASAPVLAPEFEWGETNLGRVPELNAAMGSSGEAAERFNRGARCFTASIDGQIVAYGWLTPGSECIGELERHIRLGPAEAYIWDCSTLPQFRRRGLYTGILRLMISTLAREAFTRAWIGAALSNRPSIRGFAATGFLPVLTVVYLRVGRMSCLFTRPFPEAPADLVDAVRRAVASPEERRWGPLYLRRINSSRLQPCSSELGA